MLLRLLLLFTLVPLVELVLLLVLADKIGWQVTLGVVLGTGVLGASLARWQGIQVWRRAHRELSAGRLPGDALLDGLMVLVAGALLVTPGALTDALGFALLLPPFRTVIKRRLIRQFQSRVRFAPPPEWRGFGSGVTGDGPRRPGHGDQAANRDEIIDARVIDDREEHGGGKTEKRGTEK
jgi:UPF0716 protein FxsA